MFKWLFLVAAVTATCAHANAPFFSTRFGNNGAASIAFDVSSSTGVGGDNGDVASAAALLPDGRLVLGGHADNGPFFENSTGNFYPSDFAIGVLQANGQPDPNFGDGGRQLLGITTGGPTVATIDDLGVTIDEKIVYAGDYLNFGGAPSVVVGRLRGDGNPDTAFNGSGRRLFSPSAFAPDADNLYSLRLKLQSDGKVLVAASVYATATSKACIGIARLLAPGAGDGAFDPSFGQGQGLVCVAPALAGGTPLAIGGNLVVLADGRILVGATVKHAGGSGADMGVARLHADGSLDTSFGSNGWAFAAFDQGSSLNDFLNAITVDNAGRIVIVGWCQTATGSSIAVARLSAEGSLDNGFGTHGTVVASAGDFSRAQDVVALPDGRVLIAGSHAEDNHDQGVLVMLKSNGSLDSTFGSGGVFSQPLLQEIQRVFVSGDFLYLAGFQVRTDSTGKSNTDFAASKYLWNGIFADGLEIFNP